MFGADVSENIKYSEPDYSNVGLGRHGVLIFAAGSPDDRLPGTIWLRRYLDLYNQRNLYWWEIGSRHRSMGGGWVSKENVIHDRVFFECNRLKRRFGWRFLSYCAIKRLIRHRHFRSIGVILVVVDLFTWPYISQLLAFGNKPVIGIVHDDLIPLFKMFSPSRTPPSLESLMQTLGKMHAVAVISEEMADKYRRAGLTDVKLLFPIGLEGVYDPGTRRAETCLQVGVIGSIYGRGKLLEFLILLDDSLGRRNRSVKFHLTRHPDSEVISTLEKCHNISAVYLGEIPEEEIQAFARGMDCLFMNAAFGDHLKELISTQFASKLPVYINLGRPIMLLAPDYYPPAEFLSDKSFGICVTEPNKATVEDALNKLLDIGDGKKFIEYRAYEKAAEKFNPRTNRARLRKTIARALFSQSD